ncbi:MAG: YbjN domain-containing protein [Rhodothalassiaceae bacterium]
MTSLVADEIIASSPNPLDLVEDLANANDWVFERETDELTAAVPGGFCEYQLRFFWREEERVLQLAAVFDGRVAEAKRAQIYETLALINERLWLGHFEMWCDEGLLMFRHATIADEESTGISGTHLATIVETALSECERFYPVFQFVLWGGKTPREALDAAMLETMGEA